MKMKKVFFFLTMLVIVTSCQKFNSMEDIENYFEESYDYYQATKKDLFKTKNKAIERFQTIRNNTAPNKKYANEHLYNRATTWQLMAMRDKGKDSDDLEKVAREWVNAYPNKESYIKLSRHVPASEKTKVLEDGCNKGINLYGEIGDFYSSGTYKDMTKAKDYYIKAIEKGDLAYCHKVAEIYINEKKYYVARDFLYKYVRHSKDNLWTIANALEKLATIDIENDKEFGLNILNRLISEFPDKINYREKKIWSLIRLERFYAAESTIDLTADKFQKFNKKEFMGHLIAKEFETSGFTCSRINDNDSFWGFFLDEKIELSNGTRFYIKNINLTINSSYKQFIKALSPHSSEALKTKSFANSQGEKLDRDRYNLIRLDAELEIEHNGYSIKKSIYWDWN